MGSDYVVPEKVNLQENAPHITEVKAGQVEQHPSHSQS